MCIYMYTCVTCDTCIHVYICIHESFMYIYVYMNTQRYVSLNMCFCVKISLINGLAILPIPLPVTCAFMYMYVYRNTRMYVILNTFSRVKVFFMHGLAIRRSAPS